MDVPASLMEMRDGKMAGNHVLKCHFRLVAFVVFLYRNGDVPTIEYLIKRRCRTYICIHDARFPFGLVVIRQDISQ